MASWIFVIVGAAIVGCFAGHIIDLLRGIHANLAGIDERLKIRESSSRPTSSPHSDSREWEIDGVKITWDGQHIDFSGPDEEAVAKVIAGFGMTLERVPGADEVGGAA